MNAPLLPEVLLRSADDDQAALPLGATGVQRWVWESRFGPILIEVRADAVFVNGQRVDPHRERTQGACPAGRRVDGGQGTAEHAVRQRAQQS